MTKINEKLRKPKSAYPKNRTQVLISDYALKWLTMRCEETGKTKSEYIEMLLNNDQRENQLLAKNN